IPTVAAAGQKDVNSQLHAHSSNLSSMNNKKTYNTASVTLMYAVMIQDRVSLEATPESLHPSILDEEEVLRSPPLDDLAFFEPLLDVIGAI
nr:probable mediator of RNA polymerase II transcription subunit 26b [Tanacetum cinerariifolium]